VGRIISEESKNKIREKILVNHGKTLEDYISRKCNLCKKQLKSTHKEYCSMKCYKTANPYKTNEELKKMNADGQARWRAKKLKVFAPTADSNTINNIYIKTVLLDTR
jgi:Fe-S-cluster-containing dehydrogenase component